MARGLANCAVCGEPLQYLNEAQDVVCAVCGAPDVGRCVCACGHYVCDACHRSAGVDAVMEACRATDERNPIVLANVIMEDARIYPNGPEHHSLVGAVLLACYSNSGGEVDLEAALEELKSRSMQVPGGTCGYWGCCGAAISAGQFFSVVSGCTPLEAEPWAQAARLTSDILGRIADVGGPRCCKRTCFIAIETAVQHVERELGVAMELPERTTCTFMSGNAQCRRRGCPYFPA
ncbi:MAG: SAM-dependent methyltransferase [Eggerthellaceae bacterium]|nr:SAM-dependent methyltransferase [Eggerthellaceae bacterium]